MHSPLLLSTRLAIWMSALLWVDAVAQTDPATDAAREQEVRARYEAVLLRNPFQERAFNSVYDGYAKGEGVDRWIEKLKPMTQKGEEGLAALLLLGQVHDRQFQTAEAMAAFEQAAARGENRGPFKLMLGTLYYKAGRDEPAAKLLSEALDALTDLDQRAGVSRLLGSLFLRQGKRDEAVRVWQRLAEQNPDDVFAQLELADIYEENRLWDQAIEVYRRVAERSTDDPYRRCRALRSIGQCHTQAERFKEAIAVYEQAMELVAPGNWLFEDLKLRLVGVYEDIGDLAGLVKYLEARLERNAADREFRDLLAETFVRMAKFDAADQQYRELLARNPRDSGVYEKLIVLHERTGKKTEVTAAFEKLIELYPTDSDYLRRLGEFYLRDSRPDQAKETWRRLVKDQDRPEKQATLAGWFAAYEFADDAIAAYRAALAQKPDKEWTERLATLCFQKGDEATAVQLWLSLINEQSKPEECAEIASILESNNRYDEALKLRQQAVAKAPDQPEHRLAYAKALLKKKQFEAAAAEFTRLAAQDQNEFLMQQGEQGLVEAWRELGVLEEKQKALETEVAANPTDARKLGQLGRFFEQAGQREKAIRLYETRREKEPDNLEYQRVLARLYQAAKQTEEALSTYKTLLSRDKPRARVYQKELFDIYLGVDLKEESIAAGEALVSLAPGDPESHLALAQVYHQYRQPEKAFAEYRVALRLEPNEPDYHRQYGEALEREKRYGDAQDAFRKMLDTAKEDSTRLAAVAALARLHLQQDRLNDLTGEFQRRIRNTPKKLTAYEELAAIYREAGQVARGVEVLESGLNTVDDKSAALKSLIRATFEAQDFPKVKSYYEQLIGLSGKPTANEFERLGQIYAQVGEIEKARQTWNRIVTEAPKDPKAHDRLAQILRDSGFTEEAIAIKARAVELEPQDYRRRFEYAQLLAQTEQPVEALKQLNQILDLGDGEQAKEEAKSPEKKVPPLLPGGQGTSAMRAYQFSYGMRYYGGGYYGGGWQGSFKQFRPQILMFMGNVAQQSIGEDAFVEQFRERAKKAGGAGEAQRDLLTILEMYNRVDDAFQVAQELLAQAPNDVDLLQRAALFLQNQQKLDQAIPLLERLAQAQPKYRLQALQGLLPLYYQNKQEDKAMQLADQLLQENPRDLSTVWAIGSFLQQQGKTDRAKALYTQALELDPQMRPNLLLNLASMALQENKPEEARTRFIEVLTADFTGPQYAWMGPRRQASLYVPAAPAAPGMPMRQVYYGAGPMGRLPPSVMGQVDYTKQNALQQLKMLAKRPGAGEATNDFTADLEKIARGYRDNVSATARNRAWDTAKLLYGCYLGDKQPERALDLLQAMRTAGYEGVDWFNLSVFLAEQKEDYDRMIALYDEVHQRFPAQAREVIQAKAMTLVRAKRYDDAAKLVREMNQQRVPPAQILGLIQGLRAAGEKRTARALLEEHLAGASRNPDALQQLAQLYAEDNDYDKAIALASEAWERKAHGRVSYGYLYGARYGYGGYVGGSSDSLLADLHRYYVAQGKSDDLVQLFKQRLDKQPSSVQAHENLAQIYRLNENRPAALALYQQLAQKRPHLHQIRRQIAQLFTEMGESKKATEYYEELIKASPSNYEQFQWELRWLYQRMGKGQELAQMEQRVIEKARNPQQIRQVADRLNEDGEYDQAADLYRKLIKMSPADPWIKNQLAQVFVNMGRLDEAVTLYREWMESPQLRAQGWVDHATLRNLVGLFRATGRLDELKQHAEKELKRNPNDRPAQALQAHIAVLEKRFADAVTGFKTLMEAQRDPNGMWQLMELSDITGDTGPVFEAIEKADPNNLDQNRLAQLYLGRGDRAKAEELILQNVERQTGFGNGGWVLREALNQFCQCEMWDAADRFIRKHRDTPLQQWEQQEFDGVIAEQYIREKRFAPIIEEILKKESFKGRDLELLKTIVQRYQWQNQPARRREFLEKICAADPKNKELNFQLAEAYDEQTEGAKKLALLERLVGEEPTQVSYQETLARCRLAMGRGGEAMDALKRWVEEKPLEVRWSALSRLQLEAGQVVEARASLVKAGEAADPSRKDELRLQLARLDAEQGEPEAVKPLYREIFEKKKDQNNFYACLSGLLNLGFRSEAHEFFVANKDGGFLEQYRGDEALGLCLDLGDYHSVYDLSWRFTRYGERWNRTQFLGQVSKLCADRGKLPMFLEDYRARLDAETNRNQFLRQVLADGWVRAGDLEKAITIIDETLKVSPFQRAAISTKAQLWASLGREDEALALLREFKGVQSLTDEIDARFQLIEMLARFRRPAEAEKELEALLAWSQGAGTLERAAGVYRELKRWDKAAELLERVSKTVRGWNYTRTRVQLAQCYAKLGRLDDALKIWDTASGSVSNYGDGGDFATANQWLASEGLHEATLKLAQARVSKDPEALDAFVAMAYAQLNLGRTNDAWAAFRTAGTTFKPERQGELRERLLGFILEKELLPGAVQQCESSPFPLLSGVMVMLYGRADVGSERAKLLGPLTEKLSVDDLGLQLALAEARQKHLGNPGALEPLRRALTTTNFTQRLEAARLLIGTAASSEVIPFLSETLRLRPQLFLRDLGPSIAAAKTRDPGLVEQLGKTLQQGAVHEGQRDFYATLLTYYRGQTNEARTKLSALANSAKLTSGQLYALANMCSEQGLNAERVAVYRRLAAVGQLAEARGAAMGELVNACVRSGDFRGALQALVDLPGTWRLASGADLRETLAQAVTADNFASFKNAVLSVAKEIGQLDIASSLLGFGAQVGQRLGHPESAAAWAALAQVSALEQAEAAAWDELIETWEVAGPIRSIAQEPPIPVQYDQYGTPIARPPARQPEPELATNLVWKKTDPKRELGTIRLAPLLGLRVADAQGQCAYARATLNSPTDRIVTLACGSDDTLAVWVNGQQVGSSSDPRSLNLDQDRFQVHLKPGPNRVLLKIGNLADDWGFCLRVASGREGITVAGN